jgi:hypothetical protein
MSFRQPRAVVGKKKLDEVLEKNDVEDQKKPKPPTFSQHIYYPGTTDLHPLDSTVILAFRHLGDPKTAHYMNRWAVYLTRMKSDIAPGGNFCHVEILFPIGIGPDGRIKYKSGSVNMANGVQEVAGGPITFTPGKVHILDVRELSSLDQNYTYVHIPVDRKDMEKGWKFLVSQMDAGFNKFAYYANILYHVGLSPVPFGATQYKEEMTEEQKKWFCTELIVCVLQCMGVSEFIRDAKGNPVRASASNPNDVFRRAQGYMRSPYLKFT